MQFYAQYIESVWASQPQENVQYQFNTQHQTKEFPHKITILKGPEMYIIITKK